MFHAAPSVAKDIVGTTAYMVPEIAVQTEPPPELKNRADVSSLACVAYELFTGKPPSVAPTLLALMIKHATSTALPPSKLRGTWPTVSIR